MAQPRIPGLGVRRRSVQGRRHDGFLTQKKLLHCLMQKVSQLDK